MTSHRQWPLPDRAWSVAMQWHELLFLHWPVDTAAVRERVPPGLEVDTWDGTAWLGVVPFGMGGVRHRRLPPVPTSSAFLELNVRTYVTHQGKRGVWFFSLDAASRLAVWGARAAYHLPYHFATMRMDVAGDTITYSSRRRHRDAPPAEFAARYGPIGEVFTSQHGSFEHWATARYCLYAADRRGKLYRSEIDHPPWPLQGAWADVQCNTMAQAAGLSLPDLPPVPLFARHIQVQAWSLDQLNSA